MRMNKLMMCCYSIDIYFNVINNNEFICDSGPGGRAGEASSVKLFVVVHGYRVVGVVGFYINDDRYNIEHIHDVKNRDEHMLKSTLITEKGKRCSKGKCIIFLHGLGSTRLEAFPMVEALPEDYSLFCFDFSGSGKSEGSNITYGLKEAEDV
jgi:pimeloyl-ACP methyl ester carboxylesterase